MDLGLAGRTALVLGATRGLGAAIARSLVAEGVTVIAAGRNLATLGEWLPHLSPDERKRVRGLELDLASLGSVDALADMLLGGGGVDILVNNSGGPPPSAAAATTRGDWLAWFEPMAANLFHLTGRLLPPMRERRWGRIISIASSGIEQPIPGLAISNALRSSLVGWSKTLAAEVAAEGITVNVVLPGRIATDRVRQLDEAAAKRQGKPLEEVRAASRATIPAGRYGDPSEFADVVAFLASERASYVTGSKIRVDGGAIRGI
jgi:3-oxoacyl-[acyl-carrier protein] reductase